MSKNLIDAIDNFSESLKGENVDSINLVQAIDNLSDAMNGNSPNEGGNSSASDWDLSDRIAKGTDEYGDDAFGAVIIGQVGGQFGNKATAQYTIAEGYETTASGSYSHAEGNATTASGSTSHAEGCDTTASGSYAHAEGYGTISSHNCQHVFGRFNVADPSTQPASYFGTYVEIVGKGTNNNNRANARTLDWNGNEKLTGNLTLGAGTSNETTITAAQLKQLLDLLTQ